MHLQVLITTMNQSDFKKYDEMNLQSDALFANQASTTGYATSDINGHKVEMVTTNTRGVGKNRNIALLHASGEILLIADDDLRYVDGYESIITNAFETIKGADAIIFNIETIGKDLERRVNNKISKVNYLNAFNYGAVRIAVKKNSIKREGITFNENFGGGTMYSAGEDSLFIRDLLKHHLSLYVYPKKIATVNQLESTWFTGYNEKYFYDKGALFYALNSKLFDAICIQDYIRHKELYKESNLSATKIIELERRGAKGYVELKPFHTI